MACAQPWWCGVQESSHPPLRQRLSQLLLSPLRWRAAARCPQTQQALLLLRGQTGDASLPCALLPRVLLPLRLHRLLLLPPVAQQGHPPAVAPGRGLRVCKHTEAGTQLSAVEACLCTVLTQQMEKKPG